MLDLSTLRTWGTHRSIRRQSDSARLVIEKGRPKLSCFRLESWCVSSIIIWSSGLLRVFLTSRPSWHVPAVFDVYWPPWNSISFCSKQLLYLGRHSENLRWRVFRSKDPFLAKNHLWADAANFRSLFQLELFLAIAEYVAIQREWLRHWTAEKKLGISRVLFWVSWSADDILVEYRWKEAVFAIWSILTDVGASSSMIYNLLIAFVSVPFAKPR